MSDPSSRPHAVDDPQSVGEPRADSPFADLGSDAQPWLDSLDRLRASLNRTVRDARREPAGETPTSGALLDLLPEDARSRLERVATELAARPDPFGLEADGVRSVLPILWALHQYWFRVTSRGLDRIPSEGPAILVANHGGVLPFDGAMIGTEVLLHLATPRIPRPLVARFVEDFGPIERLLQRIGGVVGRRTEFRQLIERGELVLVFPEGVDGILKPVQARNQLQSFHPGFAEEAIRQQVPIIPIAIAGPEDQAPLLADLGPLAERLGLPAFPITPTFPLLGPLGLLPYPVRYRIDVGQPFTEPAPLEPEALEGRAKAVAGRVRSELDRRLARLRNISRLE
jgi:1-acyl-sn-glycerol-3-phosphate acyltransferase